MTTISHRGPLMPWLRPRAPIPSGSYRAWVSLRPGLGALSGAGRAWCPLGFIRQNGVCSGKARPQASCQGHAPLCCLGSHSGWASGVSGVGGQSPPRCTSQSPGCAHAQGAPKRGMEYFPNHLTSGHFVQRYKGFWANVPENPL